MYILSNLTAHHFFFFSTFFKSSLWKFFPNKLKMVNQMFTFSNNKSNRNNGCSNINKKCLNAISFPKVIN